MITAAWWALALWPAGSVEPEWLARTRAACFGSARGGLPDAGGWILLVGEPLGMLVALRILFGDRLRREQRWLATYRAWRVGLSGGLALLTLGIAVVGARSTGLWAAGRERAEADWRVSRVDRDAPAVTLVDQAGRRTTFADFRGRSVLVTFAFGHCSTVCPAMVNDLRAARRGTGPRNIPIIVVTLDPWRDTPDRLSTLALEWGLEADDRVLSGSIADVERALDALGIGRRRIEQNGDIEHGGAAMILDARGRIAWRLDGSSRGTTALVARL